VGAAARASSGGGADDIVGWMWLWLMGWVFDHEQSRERRRGMVYVEWRESECHMSVCGSVESIDIIHGRALRGMYHTLSFIGRPSLGMVVQSWHIRME